jgi:hypothetical protein
VQHTDTAFEVHRLRFNRTYTSPKEQRSRRHSYMHNKRFVESQNRARLSYQLELNHMADFFVSKAADQTAPPWHGAHVVVFRKRNSVPSVVSAARELRSALSDAVHCLAHASATHLLPYLLPLQGVPVPENKAIFDSIPTSIDWRALGTLRLLVFPRPLGI